MSNVLDSDLWPTFYVDIEKALSEHAHKHPKKRLLCCALVTKASHRSVAAAELFGAIAADR